MAYISQEEKKKLAPQIKSILKKYGMRGSISIRNHSTLVVKIFKGELDVMQNAWDNSRNKVQQFPHERSHYLQVRRGDMFSGKVKEFFSELLAAMRGPNYFDHSDIMSDYFHCSHYYQVNVGEWNKPYVCEK